MKKRPHHAAAASDFAAMRRIAAASANSCKVAIPASDMAFQ